MSTLPQLIEEDVRQLDGILRELVASSDVTTVVIIDKGGFLIAKGGVVEGMEITTLSALASGAYLATQQIAHLLGEANFDCVYQQGGKSSMLVLNVDESCLLVLIFRAEEVSAGAAKYFAAAAAAGIARQLQVARQRIPGAGLDLSGLNVADTAPLFRKRTD